MWEKEKAAHKAGKRIQRRYKLANHWTESNYPVWSEDGEFFYRIHPQDDVKIITSWLLDSNGFTRKKKYLTAAFSFLWLGDVITTIAFTTKHGLEMEGNPLMREVIAELGYGGFTLLKLVVLIMWLMLAGRMATWLLVGAVAVMLPIVIVNSIVAWYPI